MIGHPALVQRFNWYDCPSGLLSIALYPVPRFTNGLVRLDFLRILG
eukprot:SAG25_NODE_12322_length_282_cov_0.846995_1_plen_45_part_01